MSESELGARLRVARHLGGVSARELSALIGVASGHVALIESGERPDPRSTTVARAAEVLGVSTDYLICGTGPEPTAEQVQAAVERARLRCARTSDAPPALDAPEEASAVDDGAPTGEAA
jgi:transcriptional regulator with XRE-family HTH domain